MRSLCCAVFVLLILPLSATWASEEEPIPLWPGTDPGETQALGDEEWIQPKPEATKKVTRLTNVSRPTISIHPPTGEKKTSAAVIVCPGGGYGILAWDIEGEEVVAWLNRIGVTGVLLKYRVPHRGETT